MLVPGLSVGGFVGPPVGKCHWLQPSPNRKLLDIYYTYAQEDHKNCMFCKTKYFKEPYWSC